MTKRALIVCFFAFGPPLFAQLDSNTVTVTASASTTVQPDQVVFSITVGSGLNTSLDDVLAALKTSGITIANFSGVSSYALQLVGNAPQPPLQWSFSLAVPFAQMKATIALLSALQPSVAQANGLTLSFQVSGTQASAALLQSLTCNLTELIANATTQAQKLASAAGLSVGPILAMSSGTSTPVSGVFSVSAVLGSLSSLTTSQNCSVTVKFSLLKY